MLLQRVSGIYSFDMARSSFLKVLIEICSPIFTYHVAERPIHSSINLAIFIYLLTYQIPHFLLLLLLLKVEDCNVHFYYEYEIYQNKTEEKVRKAL